jgi:taurine transport system substrate-binding protein
LMRKLFTALLTLLLAGVLLAGCGSQKDTRQVIRIGYQVIPNTEAVAKANRWHETTIKQAEIKWIPFHSGRDVNTALASGSIDIGLVGTTAAATGISKGIDYQVIWIADVIGSNEALVVKKKAGIHSVADLKGKTIAVTFGSTTQYALLGALKLNQIPPSQVKIIDMQPPDMLAAWKRGDIDGAYVWEPTLYQMVQDGGAVVTDSGKLADKGIVTADLIVARRSFIKEHGDLAAAYLASEIRAVDQFRINPDESATSVAKDFSISKGEALAMMKELIWLSGKEQTGSAYLGTSEQVGRMTNVLEDTARFLHDQRSLENVPSSDRFKHSMAPGLIQNAMAYLEEKK